MVLYWNLSDSKSPQVSRTLFSILDDPKNAVFWTVSSCPFIFKSSSPFTNPTGNVPSTITTIRITVIFMLHSFFNSLARPRYLSLFCLSFIFTLVSWDGNYDFLAVENYICICNIFSLSLYLSIYIYIYIYILI